MNLTLQLATLIRGLIANVLLIGCFCIWQTPSDSARPTAALTGNVFGIPTEQQQDKTSKFCIPLEKWKLSNKFGAN